MLVVAKTVIECDSDGILENGKCFVRGRRIVYKDTVVPLELISFVLSLFVLLYCKENYNLETTQSVPCSNCRNKNFELLVSLSNIKLQFQISPMPNPASYTRPCLTITCPIFNVPTAHTMV